MKVLRSNNGLYQKNVVQEKWAILVPKMVLMVDGQNYVSCFLRKKLIWGNLIFLGFKPLFIL